MIPASGNPERLAKNLKATGVELDAAEIARMRLLNTGERLINPEKSPKWDD